MPLLIYVGAFLFLAISQDWQSYYCLANYFPCLLLIFQQLLSYIEYMPRRKIKPDEVKIREQQMKKFRYDAARITGLVLSILGNGFIILTFAIFMISFISGLFEGVDAGTSWNESFILWKMVCDKSLLPCVVASSLLALAVRILSHDAKGRDTKTMRKATDRSIFTLLVFMSSVSVLYMHSQS